jgi:hypothetical protein
MKIRPISKQSIWNCKFWKGYSFTEQI